MTKMKSYIKYQNIYYIFVRGFRDEVLSVGNNSSSMKVTTVIIQHPVYS